MEEVGLVALQTELPERDGEPSRLRVEGIEVHDFKDQLLRDDFGLLVLPKEFRKHLVGEVGLEV